MPDFTDLADDERTAAVEGGEPLDDDDDAGRVPFPVDALPLWCGDFVSALAESTQTAPDIGGALALAVLAGAVMGRFEAAIGGDHVEPVTLYVLGVADSGDRKSALVRALIGPVREAEREHESDTAAVRAEARAARRVLEKRRDKLVTEAANAKDTETRAALELELGEVEQRLDEPMPPAPRLIMGGDFTDEALGRELAELGRVAIFTAEAGPIFDNLQGRYTKGGAAPSMGALLAGHAGDAYDVDRLGRERIRVPKALVTIGALGQPSVLRGLGRNEAALGRGAPARFLYTLPRSRVGYRRVDAEAVPSDVREGYGAAVRALYRARTAASGPPTMLPFTTGARATFDRWRQPAEHALRPGGDLAPFTGWGSKLPGQVARIAAVLAVADAPEARPVEVATDHAERAIRIGEHFRSEMPRALALMGQDPTEGTPSGLADKLELALKRAGAKGLNVTEAHAATGRNRSSRELRAALGQLVTQGRARCDHPGRRGARWRAR